MLEYADRHGIVVIDETPAVGLNMGLGGGIFGSQGFTTFSEETINAATQDAHRRVIGELIARDKNHPCVVIWSIANEPESDTPASRAYFEPLAQEARRLDPTRPVGFVNVMLAPADKDVVADMFDVRACSTATTAGTSTPATCPPPSARSRPSSTRGRTSSASRSS